MSRVGKSSIDGWENLYAQGQSILMYPDSTLVSLSHHLIDPRKHPKILDYGFGAGANLTALLKRGLDVSGVEVSSSAIKIVRQRLKKERLKAELTLFNGNDLPFDDNTFNVIIAWHVLCYNTWDSLSAAVKEINRVLSPGGMFIGTMPVKGGGFYQHAKPLGQELYQLTMDSQKDMIVIIPDKKGLERCFPGIKITVGETGLSYKNLNSRHWIVTYEKK